MTSDSFVKAHLALLAWREAPDRDMPTMRAVATVIRNRVRAGWHGGDWMQVIANHKTYLATDTANGTTQESWPDSRDVSFVKFLSEIDGIFTGLASEDRLTHGALWYAPELKDANRTWFVDKIIRSAEHPRIAVVGKMVLFK